MVDNSNALREQRRQLIDLSVIAERKRGSYAIQCPAKVSCCLCGAKYFLFFVLFWVVALWWKKKRSCDDTLRHGSPFGRGACRCSTALWDRWAHAAAGQSSCGVSSLPLQWVTDWHGTAAFCICPLLLLFFSRVGSAVFTPSFCPPAVHLSLSTLVFISRPPLAESLLPTLLTVCPRRQVIELGVGWLHPPGILLPSRCHPAKKKERDYILN